MKSYRTPGEGLFHDARRRMRGERGMLMVECLIGVAVFALVGVAILTTLQTGSIATNRLDQGSTVENIIRNQIEAVFAAPYQGPGGSYAPITPPAGYSVATEALTYDLGSSDIELLRVTVERNGQALRTFETLRANR